MIINSKIPFFFWILFYLDVLLHSMKKTTIVIFCLMFALGMSAQDVDRLQSKVEPADVDVQTETTEVYRNGMMPVATFNHESASYADSLHLPEVDYNGRIPRLHSWYTPYLGYGIGTWQLHEGLNVNLGLSAFTSFGKHSFNGWSRDVSVVYAKPINDKLSIALGGYLNSISSNIGSYNEGGLTAMLDYRFNDHWEAYLFAQKSFLNDNTMMFSHRMSPMYMMYSPFYNGGDRIGGGVRYHFNNDNFIQFQFEYQQLPDFHRSIEQRWQHPDQK